MSLGVGPGNAPIGNPLTITESGAKGARDREVGEDAERFVARSDDASTPPMHSSVQDDAPPVDAVHEAPRDDNEDPPIADDGEQDPPDRAAGWDPWIRLTIFRDEWGLLSFHVEHPDVTDRAIEEILDLQDRNWEKLANTLIGLQPDALACHTPLEALEALWSVTKQEYQRSVGQLSRDKHIVVGTPFGTVPLDFLFIGRRTPGCRDTLFADLRKVGEHLLETGVKAVPAPELRVLLPHLGEPGIESTRKHVAALVKVLANPHVVTRHRQFWPHTSEDALYDDLGIKPHTNDHSTPAAILAILGAFERGNPVLARGPAPRLPREARKS